MPGQEVGDLIKPFRQDEFRRAVSRAGDDSERTIDAGIPEGRVQSQALDQRYNVVPVAVNVEKRSATAMHMMKRAGAAGLFQVL
jgi:hypothetical protein